MLLAAALLPVALLLFWAFVEWRARHDVWITTTAAPLFSPGDSITISGTGSGTKRGRVLRVGRSTLLVRPCK